MRIHESICCILSIKSRDSYSDGLSARMAVKTIHMITVRLNLVENTRLYLAYSTIRAMIYSRYSPETAFILSDLLCALIQSSLMILSMRLISTSSVIESAGQQSYWWWVPLSDCRQEGHLNSTIWSGFDCESLASLQIPNQHSEQTGCISPPKYGHRIRGFGGSTGVPVPINSRSY